jgi:hypothetical protein
LKRLQVRTFEGLEGGVQEMAVRGGKAENFEKKRWRKRKEGKSKSGRPDPVGACGTQILAFD